MGNLFGIRRRVPVVTAQDRAILQLKQQRDKIRIFQKKTEDDLEKNKELALKLFQNGLKDRAIIVLRRKKYMEDALSRTDKQLETLEQLVTDIEYTQIEVSVVEGLKVGTEALKQLNNLMDIDDIQKMMEDNEEAAQKQKEISDILLQTSERYDEDELLQELEVYKAKAAEEVVTVEESDRTSIDAKEQSDNPTENASSITTEPTISDDMLPDVPNTEPVKEPTPKKETRQLEPAQ